MESDDLVLVIVNEEDEKFDELQYTINYKQEDEIIVKTEKEVPDDDFEYEYLEDADLLEVKTANLYLISFIHKKILAGALWIIINKTYFLHFL